MSKSRFHYGWVVVFVGMLTTIGAHGFGRMAYTLILPEMAEGLSLSWTQAGLLGTGNFIGYLAFALVGGFLAARYGSRHLISLSLSIMGITMLLTGMTKTFESAFLLRLLTGVGNGGAYVPAMALGSVWFASRYRGFATGIVSGGIGVGTLISGLFVPYIFISYAEQGWRYSWYYLGALVLIISLVCYILLRDRPEDLGLKAVGGELTNSTPMDGSSRTGIFEWDRVYRVKEVWHLSIVYFMYGFSYVIYMTFFKAFLSTEAGLSGPQASTMWAMVGGLSIFCGVIWGGISDYLGRRYGAALAYLTLATSYLAFALFGSVQAFYASVVLFGLSAWSLPTIMAATAGDYVGPRLAPAGVGFITLFFGIGQILGPAAGGYVADMTGTFTNSFILAALVSMVGLVGSLLLRKPAPKSVK